MATEPYTFVLRGSLVDALEGENREILEAEILPSYVAQRRWFQGKNIKISKVRIAATAPLPGQEQDAVLAAIEVTTALSTSRYAFPISIAWEDEEPCPFEVPLAFARVRRGRRVGLLTDGFASARFARSVLANMARNTHVPFGGGELEFRAMPGVDLDLPTDAEIEWPRAEQSNSSCIVERKAVIKLFRRVTTGIHPEVEMGRILTQRNFTGIPPLLGEVSRRDSEGTTTAVGIVQGFIANQGDGSGWTKEILMRIVDEQSVAPRDRNPFGAYEGFARVLGRRTGEMHSVLAEPTDNPDFAPEAASESTVQHWFKQARWQLEEAFRALEKYTGHQRASLTRLNEQRDHMFRALQGLLLPNRGAACTRIHGDFHLGQVLVAGSDVIIIDFEGEPLKPLTERRAKLSPMRDVAGMIRSFDYAAGVVEREGQLSAAGRGHVRAHSLLDQFRHAAEGAFLAGYEEGRGKPLSRKERHLIRAFTIEKAAYEIVYEAANRPDWIDIPLRGLAALLEGQSVEPEFADAE